MPASIILPDALVQHNVKFIDNEWLPNENALYGHSSALHDPTKPIVWQRAAYAPLREFIW
jgi:hypothetical protein